MKNKKNILIVSALFPPEPVVSAKISYDLVTSLFKENNLTLFTPRPSRPLGFDFSKSFYIKNNQDFKHIISKSYINPKSNFLGRLLESFCFGYSTANYINRNWKNIDIIYANTWPLFAQFFVVYVSKKHRIPIIIHIQDIYPETIKGRLPILSRIILEFLFKIDCYILKNSTKIITISNSMCDYLIKSRNLEKDKISVVYNWQDEQTFIKKKDSKTSLNKSEIFRIMYVGSVVSTAALDFVLKSIININDSTIEFIIAGDGFEKRKLQKISEKHKTSKITFCNVNSKNVAELQSTADVLLLSLKRGVAQFALPSKLSAYMLSSKPIIAIVERESETGKIIESTGCGWVSEPENQESLISLIKIIRKKDKNEMVDMGKKGFNFAINNMTKLTCLNKINTIILDLQYDN